MNSKLHNQANFTVPLNLTIVTQKKSHIAVVCIHISLEKKIITPNHWIRAILHWRSQIRREIAYSMNEIRQEQLQ